MASLNLRQGLAVLISAGLLTLLFNTLPLEAEDVTAKSEAKRVDQAATALGGKRGVMGVATYYASKYNGRRTYSGEVYQPQKMTAAHPSFPMGTRVRVVSMKNSRHVEVRINDRCRQKKHPTIDLSLAAAKQLGFLNEGVTRVKMRVLGRETM
jgi:rare lipoprotein A